MFGLQLFEIFKREKVYFFEFADGRIYVSGQTEV